MKQVGSLRDLKEEVEFMSGLTTELLTFARAEMRPEAIKPLPLNLRQIVERAVEVERGESEDIRIEIDPSNSNRIWWTGNTSGRIGYIELLR